MFRNKVILITGSSRGIGRAMALRFAKDGAKVVINYAKNKDEAERVQQGVIALGGEAITVQANVAKEVEIKALFSHCLEHFGGLDVFIHNAAKGVFGPLHRIGANGFEMALATGPKALLTGIQQAILAFGQNGGCIIAMSSIGNVRVLPDYTALGTAKAALETVVKYAAVECGTKGIRVNAISAGPVETDALNDFKDNQAKRSEWVKKTPLGRLGTAEEIAEIAYFLASPAASWIHGQVIIADGGYTLI